MIDKVQKIIAEIKDRISNYQEYIDSGYGDEEVIKQEELKDLLTSIDFMQEEPVSEDLDKAVVEYITQFSGENYYNSPWAIDSTGMAMPKELARFGAEWQKKQMMAKAVDGYVIEDIEEGNGDFLLSAEYLPKSMGLKNQQKVKVIVIKED